MLGDGAFHSGTDLGKKLGITRAAVCKQVQQLARTGVEVRRVTGRGYRLEAPLDLLDKTRLLKLLGSDGAKIRDRLHLRDEVDSTNRYLAERLAETGDIDGATCLAEAQAAGRGRRGRAWIATPYSNVMLSMAWRFSGGPALVSGLSLAAGVVLARALEEYGVSGIGLKWPNDILWDGRKLAGLLLEVQGEANGPTRVILGVGVNGRLSRADGARIDQPWIDLHTITRAVPDRTRLAALILRHLWALFGQFAEQGLKPFRADWQRRHVYHGQRVRLIQGDRVIDGTAEGIDDGGGLILRQARHTRVFHSGEVSLRPAP